MIPLDKETVLPLHEQRPDVIAAAMKLSQDFASGFLVGQAEQRDNDWGRAENLVRVLEILADPANYRATRTAIVVKGQTIAQVALAELTEASTGEAKR